METKKQIEKFFIENFGTKRFNKETKLFEFINLVFNDSFADYLTAKGSPIVKLHLVKSFWDDYINDKISNSQDRILFEKICSTYCSSFEEVRALTVPKKNKIYHAVVGGHYENDEATVYTVLFSQEKQDEIFSLYGYFTNDLANCEDLEKFQKLLKGKGKEIASKYHVYEFANAYAEHLNLDTKDRIDFVKLTTKIFGFNYSTSVESKALQQIKGSAIQNDLDKKKSKKSKEAGKVDIEVIIPKE
jgi:hypothetical protein